MEASPDGLSLVYFRTAWQPEEKGNFTKNALGLRQLYYEYGVPMSANYSLRNIRI
jgi:hypothetical protein